MDPYEIRNPANPWASRKFLTLIINPRPWPELGGLSQGRGVWLVSDRWDNTFFIQAVNAWISYDHNPLAARRKKNLLEKESTRLGWNWGPRQSHPTIGLIILLIFLDVVQNVFGFRCDWKFDQHPVPLNVQGNFISCITMSHFVVQAIDAVYYICMSDTFRSFSVQQK